MAAIIDLPNVPNLPGFGVRRKAKSHRKSQTFNVVNGLQVELQEGVTHERPKFVTVAKPSDERRVGSLPQSTTQDHFKMENPQTRTELPAWDVFDRHVLRFYGHFKEAVVETNLENFRNRHCSVLFYLEDDTCHVVEKKQDNSGIPQGGLIRRHRFPAPHGGYLSENDLQVGGVLHIYGRTISIYDCDPWTREYYEQRDQPQAPAEPREDDAFAVTMSQMSESKSVGIPRTAERLYREVQLGGGHVNADMQQFMENDRKVCRFFAVVDDLMLPQFERRPFRIHFFLADNTVEIREEYPLNCGRDSFPVYFKRGKLSKGACQVRAPFGRAAGKEEPLRLEDFAVGETLSAAGMVFYIYDADEFTRRYFKEELRAELAGAQDVRLPERTVPRPRTPEYTGYGSWDDSMGSVHQLIPKPPRRDFVKLFQNDGKVLRFTAQFATPKSEDGDRLFVLNFHLFDDTVSIHEPPQRNIGIMTGKFLEKGVHLNQMTGEIFKVGDLSLGAIIKVYNREYRIIGMDEYTKKHLESSDVPRTYNLEAVLEKIREGMRQQYPLVRDVFRKLDTDHDGVLTLREFKQALEKWGFIVSDQEALVIMRHFDDKKEGQISYNSFCDALLDQDYTTDMMKVKAPLQQNFDPEYEHKATLRMHERDETEKIRTCVRSLGDLIYRQSQMLTKVFKEFAHMTHESVVTCQEIHDALKMAGSHVPVEDVRRCVLYVLPRADIQKVNYVEFMKAMVTSYHENSANR